MKISKLTLLIFVQLALTKCISQSLSEDFLIGTWIYSDQSDTTTLSFKNKTDLVFKSRYELQDCKFKIEVEQIFNVLTIKYPEFDVLYKVQIVSQNEIALTAFKIKYFNKNSKSWTEVGEPEDKTLYFKRTRKMNN